MRALIVGDVHGCAQELRDLVARAPADRVVLVGDLFTKGPEPAATYRLVREGGWEVVLGNHDQRLLDARGGHRPGDAHAHEVLRALDAEDPDWASWLGALPLWLEVGRYRVTHAALHPSGDLSQTTRAMHLNGRRYPDDRDPNNPFWWQIYEGPPVVFGHDAARGLVRRDRDGGPWVVGLDTGCVYGGRLSGFLTESGEVVQVPAALVYCPVAEVERDRRR